MSKDQLHTAPLRPQDIAAAGALQAQARASALAVKSPFVLAAEAILYEGFLLGINSIRRSGLSQSVLAKLKTLPGPAVAEVSQGSEDAVGFQPAGIEFALRTGWHAAIDFFAQREATANNLQQLELACTTLLAENAQEKQRRGIAPFSVTVKGST